MIIISNNLEFCRGLAEQGYAARPEVYTTDQDMAEDSDNVVTAKQYDVMLSNGEIIPFSKDYAYLLSSIDEGLEQYEFCALLGSQWLAREMHDSGYKTKYIDLSNSRDDIEEVLIRFIESIENREVMDER